jgi:hypothetical protein
MDGNIPPKIHHPNHPRSDTVDGPSRKRSRRSKNNNNNNTDNCYSNVSYQERTSSGRPGSPHRYFEHSYDVSFLTDAAATVGTDEQVAVTAAAAAASAAATVDNEQQQEEQHQQQEEYQSTKFTAGKQVVHRHVNGLCIVTAGNVLQLATTTSLQATTSSSNAHSSHESQQQQQQEQQEQGQSLTVSSIKYLVKVAPDAQSAKGKLRAKNKKRRKNNHTTINSNINSNNKTQTEEAEDINNCCDGEVSPTDPLCEVYLSNGTKVTLHCCVHGTVIELNHRLGGDSNEGGKEETNVESSKRGEGGNNASSLLVTDPLLDGYLAVIMPNRGSYLPTTV